MTLHLRSTVEGREAVPGTGPGQLQKGSIALNLHPNNPFLQIQDNAGAIRRFGVWAGTAAPATPTRGELWLDTGTGALKCYDGANWVGGGTSGGGGFPSGTRMLFQQSAAPAGWVKETTHNNKALRVVSGTAGSGGTVDFTTAFSAQPIQGVVGATALTWDQMPTHNHGINDPGHGHNVNDPGHKHEYDDQGHTHLYTRSDAGVVGRTPTSGQNEQDHVRSLNQYSAGTGPSACGINIRHSGTGIGIYGNYTGISTQDAGKGQPHTHTLSGAGLNLAVAYVDVIVGRKE